jgi:hypothetical protein
MPRPGFFILHDGALPDLPAGQYTLHVNHRINVPGEPDSPIPARDAHFLVTSPSYVLPPDQILSTYPPNQAQGAFSSRLPQIVLRRRTLPWERRVSADAQTPWLALVVIADGEGELRSNVPVAQCVTPGIRLTGPRDAETGTALTVTETVLRKVFPGRDEVALLAHLREVDISDTELALGDDDGWMAVVVANRLPQPGVRYRACLISLEGQLDSLPNGAAAQVTHRFNATHVYPELARHLIRGDVQGALELARGQNARARTTTHAVGRTRVDAWSEASTPRDRAINFAGYVREGRLAGVQVGSMDLHEVHPAEALYTFPVLAQWGFACTEAGDFQSRMQELHVGLQGTLKPPTPPLAGKTSPPPTRPAPAVLATGHVQLDGITREGNSRQVWFRGPLVPRPGTRVTREPSGPVPILHVADQARRVGPEGREDISLAAAFEIGRLLALAEPAMLTALLRWRRDAFAVGRTAALLARDPRFDALLKQDFFRIPIRLERELVLSLGENRAQLIGPRLPVLDQGREFVPLHDLAATIAGGFGLSVDGIDQGPPLVEIETNFGDILAGGVAGLPHVQAALERERDLVVDFADELTSTSRIRWRWTRYSALLSEPLPLLRR